MSFRLRHWLFTVATGGFVALALLPHWQPWLGLTPASLFYLLAIPFLLLATCLLATISLLAWSLSTGESKRTWLTWLAACATMLVLAGLTLAADLALRRGLPTGSFVDPFDGAGWRDNTSSDHVRGDITPRQKMLGAAIREVVRRGNRAAITSALGPSEDGGYFAESGRDLIYRTGPQRDSLFAIDSEWLLIWLDEHGQIERYEIRSD